MKPEWEIFCREYLTDFNASRSYRVAYPECTDRSAGSAGHALLKNIEIAAQLAEQINKRKDRLDLQADDVLRKLWNVATADPNELVEVRRDSCRFCYGEGHRYQYTAGEWEEIQDQFDARCLLAEQTKSPIPPEPDLRGGLGYNKLMPPMPGCPECFGQGIENVVIKDTRTLSPAALELYAGAKVTKNGVEILTHNRDKNLELIGRHLAMFTDKFDHRSGDGSMTPRTLDDFYSSINPTPDTESGTS